MGKKLVRIGGVIGASQATGVAVLPSLTATGSRSSIARLYATSSSP